MKRLPLPPRKTPLQTKILPRPGISQLRRSPMTRTRPATTPARRAAKGQPCLINVADVCNGNPETTVLVHFRFLGDCGTSCKPTDAQAAFGCSACNTWTDSPMPRQTRDRLVYERDRNFYAARALARMRKLDQQEAA